ncbi:hypothetical protein DDZ13_13390 [Coraliomargarita sinensis]|uniref:Uncharacterized protein n=1 Tax=Coraliomargarita sinensis TaxID=2174842 RepID=A0A317ZIK3_9BACT|nr:hypothetical protein [Coraliomargarita sinensis]PXA03211.1 hypothetical protein DDZ13_13390 [Coraliomargarita sinensis]
MKHCLLISILLLSLNTVRSAEIWQIESTLGWHAAKAESEGIDILGGIAKPDGKTGRFRSILKRFPHKVSAQTITFYQAPLWLNWQPVEKVLPSSLGDAPVFLSLGPDNYWAFGLNEAGASEGTDASLKGFDIPLKTTEVGNVFAAPGAFSGHTGGGYHAWQSKDMKHWVHHGQVTNRRAKWTTTAEYYDGKLYIYYDFPNDQDPHVYVDEDLFDGKPGEDMGMAFKDPSDGSDCTIIRDLDGKFHLIYENWSPIDASKHSWDSPLAGHAVSDDGLSDFKILPPAVDVRTEPTGVFKEFAHPHWHKDDPANYPQKPGQKRAFARYEVHEPEQNAFGDWAAISIGGQYYLFGDFHPAETRKRQEMSVAWFTASDIDQPFAFCGNIGSGHPDPDIGFAEGQFYLLTQTKNDFVSPGPWVERVETRVAVDTTGNGQIDYWSDWQEVKENYDHIPGFAKQISRKPAALDLSQLPEGYGFCFEFKVTDTTENNASPLIEKVRFSFE